MPLESQKVADPHLSVLLNEALSSLPTEPKGIYIDATFGRGGHSKAILNRLGAKGRLIALDKDPAAIEFARQCFQSDDRFTVRQTGFKQLASVAEALGVLGRVNGLLFDLGVSSPQLDEAQRGFSFLHDGPLDMRMNPGEGNTVAKWLAQVDEWQLAKVFRDYGEERFSRRIAKAVKQAGLASPITRTGRLAQVISQAHPAWEKHKHPATRCFQALRIFVNDELDELQTALQQSMAVLAKGGVVVVISFHSLEDRIVKRFFQSEVKGCTAPRHLPLMAHQIKQRLKIIGKAIRATPEELAVNPRARSAIMRVAQKL